MSRFDLPWNPQHESAESAAVAFGLFSSFDNDWIKGRIPSIDSRLACAPADPEATAELMFDLFHNEATHRSKQGVLRWRVTNPREPTPSFLGRYDVIDLLGCGGVGHVFRAVDRQKAAAAAHDVAIKLLYIGSEDRGGRFRRECNAMKAYGDSPHLVRHYTSGEVGNCGFLVMQACTLTLKKYLHSYGKLRAAAVAKLGAEIALGLAHLHSQEQVHRDIKPSNIGLDTRPDDERAWRRAFVLDFGIVSPAVNDSSRTMTSTPLGTIEFMSPEQVTDSHSVGPQSDLFSLGSTLFTACTGKNPFDAGQPLSTAVLIATHTPVIPQESTDNVLLLKYVVERLLAKLPQDRPQGTLQVSNDLLAIYNRIASKGAHTKSTEPVNAIRLDDTARASNERAHRYWTVLRSMFIGTTLLGLLCGGCLVALVLGPIIGGPQPSVTEQTDTGNGTAPEEDIKEEPAEIFHKPVSTKLTSERSVRNRSAFVVRVTLTNRGKKDLPQFVIDVTASPQDVPVSLGGGPQFIKSTRIGATDSHGLSAGASHQYEVACLAPSKPGEYLLFCTLSDPTGRHVLESDDLGLKLTVR